MRGRKGALFLQYDGINMCGRHCPCCRTSAPEPVLMELPLGAPLTTGQFRRLPPAPLWLPPKPQARHFKGLWFPRVPTQPAACMIATGAHLEAACRPQASTHGYATALPRCLHHAFSAPLLYLYCNRTAAHLRLPPQPIVGHNLRMPWLSTGRSANVQLVSCRGQRKRTVTSASTPISSSNSTKPHPSATGEHEPSPP